MINKQQKLIKWLRLMKMYIGFKLQGTLTTHLPIETINAFYLTSQELERKLSISLQSK